MRFEEVKHRSRQELEKMIQDFIKKGIKKAKIIDDEDIYQDSRTMAAAFRETAKRKFPDQVKIRCSGGVVFIERLDLK